jgi:hypothetical protein
VNVKFAGGSRVKSSFTMPEPGVCRYIQKVQLYRDPHYNPESRVMAGASELQHLVLMSYDQASSC